MSLRPLTLTLSAVVPAVVLPMSGYATEGDGYLEKFVKDNDVAVCWVCRDGGWLTNATFVVHYTYKGYDGVERDQYANVCDKHVIDEVENFRDIGK